MTLELEVYSRDDLGRRLDYLPKALKPSFLDERKGDGGGSFVIHNDDPRCVDKSILQERNVVKARIDGKVRGAFIIQKRDPTYLKPGEKASELTTITGNGLTDWFRDAGLATEFGISGTTFPSRSFNFASNAVETDTRKTWYQAAKWARPYHIVKRGDKKGQKFRYQPAEWPDAPDSYWMWSNRKDAPGEGFNYFRAEFTVTKANLGSYSLYLGADNTYEAFVDGQMVGSSVGGASPYRENFEKTTRIDFEVDVPGVHVVGIKVQNLHATSRAGLIATVFKNGDATKKTKAKIVVRSRSEHWYVVGYPTTPPNWTLGEIWDVLLEEARDRGVWFAKYVKPGYTKTRDSSGQPWSRDIEWTFNVGESYLSIMHKMQELAADFWIDPDTYQLHIAQNRGVDRTTAETGAATPMLFQQGYDLKSADQKAEFDIKNTLIVNYQADKRMVVKDSASINKYGTIEDTLDLDADPGLAKLIAERAVKEYSVPTQGATYEIIPREHSKPFVDYGVGDWIMAPGESGPRTRRRIESISFSAESNDTAIRYAVEFDTVFQSRQARLERWMTNTLNGSIGGLLYNSAALRSKYTQQMGGTGNSGMQIPPVAPVLQTTNVTTSFFTTSGVAKAAATVTWDSVVETEEGGEIEEPVYELWATNLSTPAVTTPVAKLLATTTDLNAQLDDLDTEATYEFQLRAVSKDGAVSEFSEPLVLETYAPTDAPPIPTTPVLASRATSVTIEWDGNFESGESAVGVESVQAAVSTTPGGPYVSTGAPLSSDGTATIMDPPVGEVLYVVLAARSKAGVYSAYSNEEAILVQGVAESDLDESVTNIIQEAQDAAEQAAEDAANAKTTADGKNSRRRGKTQPEPPSEAGWAQGDEWIVENDAGQPIEVRVWNGTEFVFDQILSSELLILGPNGTVQIKDGRITTPMLAAGAVTTEKLTAGAVTTAKLSVGALGENSAVNGGFEDSPVGTDPVAGWTLDTGGATGASVSISGTQSATGDRSAVVITAASTGAITEFKTATANLIPVAAGDEWMVSYKLRAFIGNDFGPSCFVRWYDSAKSVISPASVVSVPFVLSNSNSSFVQRTGSVTAPVGAKFMQIVFFSSKGPINPNRASYYLDDVVAKKMVGSVNIADGAITASIVQGKSIATALTGQRVQIDINGIRTFNASNAQTASLTAGDGGLQLSGLIYSYTAGSGILYEATVGQASAKFKVSAGANFTSQVLVDSDGVKKSGNDNAPLYLGHDSNSPGSNVNVYATNGDISLSAAKGAVRSDRVPRLLWSGEIFMQTGQNANLNESVLNQLSGIVIVFSGYSSGSANNWNYSSHFVPKSLVSSTTYTGFQVFTLRSGAYKNLYVNATSIGGHADNNVSPNNGYVMRAVYGI